LSDSDGRRYEMPFEVMPEKPTVPFEIFERIDVRVGTIEKVEDMPQSDKLAKLRVNFGDRMRTIVAGIKKERTDIHEIEGRQALFVVNLEPRKIMGELSEGMLFDIGYANGIVPVLAMPERPVPDGASAG
jgi:tRNA-binding protein